MEQGLKGIFALFGGLALFLYGMDALSRSLETAAGQRMKQLLMVLAGSPVRGVLAGAAVTAVLQSSSAVTVMVLGFVSAGPDSQAWCTAPPNPRSCGRSRGWPW